MTLTQTPRTLRAAAFFDRDGTLNVDEGYTFRPEDLVWQPGAVQAIRICNDAGLLVLVVTNQSGIARGRFGEADMHAFHARMTADLEQHGARIDGFYFSPWHSDGVVPAYTIANHPDRKPRPGLLRRAMLDWCIDPTASFLVGDTDRDVAAATAVGVRAFKVAPGHLLTAVEQALASNPRHSQPPVERLLADRAERGRDWLFENALPVWWEHGFDRATMCFQERLSMDLQAPDLPRRCRVQARQTFVYVLAGRLGWTGPWREAASAGADVLLSRCLRPDGGTRHTLDQSGRPLDERRDLYDLAFMVLGLAHAGDILKRADCIQAAEALLAALDVSALPGGGYAEGEIASTPPRRQNPHMHLMEASLALFAATGQSQHLQRASALGRLFAERLYDTHRRAMGEYFDLDWRPLPGDAGRICEPGHQFEWSWLLVRLKEAGGPDFTTQGENLRVTGEVYGVDLDDGRIYDEIFIEGTKRVTSSRLWPHTERLKAHLVRYETTGDPVAGERAAAAFDALWSYLQTPTPGLWRDRRSPDGNFINEAAPASSLYHVALALSELMRVSGR